MLETTVKVSVTSLILLPSHNREIKMTTGFGSVTYELNANGLVKRSYSNAIIKRFTE